MAWLVDKPDWLFVAFWSAVAVAIAAFFGMMTFRRMTPLVFRCRRCGRTFERRAHRRFPDACALCGARDWNT